MKMFPKIDCINSLVIAIACVIISRISAQDLMYSDEEVTTSNLDFFDGENNSAEVFDIQPESKNYHQEIIKHHQMQSTPTTVTNDKINIANSNKFLSSLLPTSEEDITQRNGFLTTMMPVPDYIQMFSSSPLQMSNANEDYIKENESRSSTSLQSNETSASYSMKNSVYAPQKDTTDDDDDDDDPAQASANLSIALRNITISKNNDTAFTATASTTPSSPPIYTSSMSLFPTLLASPSYSSSGEDLNQSQMMMTMTDDFNDRGDESPSYSNDNDDGNDDNIGGGIVDDSDIDQVDAGTTTLTSVPTVRTKQGKQIQIIKLLPHEALRNFIEDAYIRTPLAALVDTSSNSLEKTKALWRDALRSNAALDIVLLAFNASGVSVTYHFQNTRTLLAGLDSIKESTTGGNAFFAIIRACELIPYDSAIFISTASIPADTNLAQYAAITLLKKRIRLYLIWFGEKTSSENETQEVTGGVLGEVAIRSGGEILHVGNETNKFDDDNMLTLISENYRGSQELEIPVETTMSNLHIKIDAMMQTATLVTPNGVKINLKNLYKPELKDKIKIKDNNQKEIDVIIPLIKNNFPTQFYLKVIPNDDDENFKVIVEATERFMENIPDQGVLDDELQTLNLVERSDNRKSVGRDEGRSFTHESIRFPDENNKDKNDSEDIEMAESINKDVEENAKQTAGINQGVTIIDLSVQSQLLVTPGMMAQLYFEITNTRTEAIYHNIQVTDEKGFLLSLSSRTIWLPPAQTTTVVVTVIIPVATPQGTRDKITFLCQGYGQVSKSLELRVISPSEIQDTTPPTLTWIFGTRCDGQYTTGSCSQRVWSLEIMAQDWETGILKIESTPVGITPRLPFTAGTTELVRTSYSATCCQPRVTITAYDLAGNQRTSTIDVRDIVLTEASIAAIVLGVLLLIALIFILIIGIVWCCRKRRRSQDLSSYRSHPERTR